MSYVSGKTLSRRTVLRGLGTALALPLIDAMVPAFSLAAATKPIHRFQTFYIPNGSAMPHWEVKDTPGQNGDDFELSPILEPLAPFKKQLIVLSGLQANWVTAHAGAAGSFLTGVMQGGRNEVEILADVSIDQLLARALGKQTQLGSLELSLDATQNAGACTANLSCVYTHTISWRGPHQPLPMEHNPRAVFERLFGDSGSTGPRRAAGAHPAAQEPAGCGERKAGRHQARHRAAGSGARWTSTPSRCATSSGASSCPRRRPRSRFPCSTSRRARRRCSRIIWR